MPHEWGTMGPQHAGTASLQGLTITVQRTDRHLRHIPSAFPSPAGSNPQCHSASILKDCPLPCKDLRELVHNLWEELKAEKRTP